MDGAEQLRLVQFFCPCGAGLYMGNAGPVLRNILKPLYLWNIRNPAIITQAISIRHL
jgi:hypothetical protein